MESFSRYFQETDAFILGNTSLRKLQREAHKRLKQEFEKNLDTHKIVVLPTGSGKTGIIALAPFEISEGRVLVITPSLIIREGISDEFDTRTIFNFWTKRKVIFDDEKLPKVYRYAGYKTPADKKRVLRLLHESNIVIANIHKVYNTKSNRDLISILEPDFFDMIIIDEAHHSAADSWLNTIDYFNAKKIIKLTATPYRADTKELSGKIIYSYDLSDAIKDGIVKNLVAEDYTNEKLEFEINGEKITLEEALESMEKNWITRSVAMSLNCSRTIVEMSIKRLKEKRELGNAHHQIIAVACSIEHAEQIKSLYEEYELTAEYVSSDRQEESEEAIIAFKKGVIDVIVNVNMLGEGFDHPNISIAAIFRPFRTLAPYAQFIGRALRKINDDSAINEIDNIAHVVYHKELDLDELWDYYTKKKVKAENRKIIELEFSRETDYIQNRDVGTVTLEGDIISSTKSFLNDGVVHKYSQAIQMSIEELENELKTEIEKMRSLDFPEDVIIDFEKVRRKRLEEKITSKRNKLREDLIREELHEMHKSDIINQIETLFEVTGLNPEGLELPTRTTNKFLKDGNNNAYVRKHINNMLKIKLKRSIDEWETYDFEQARMILPEIIKNLKDKIEGVVNNEK